MLLNYFAIQSGTWSTGIFVSPMIGGSRDKHNKKISKPCCLPSPAATQRRLLGQLRLCTSRIFDLKRSLARVWALSGRHRTQMPSVMAQGGSSTSKPRRRRGRATRHNTMPSELVSLFCPPATYIPGSCSPENSRKHRRIAVRQPITPTHADVLPDWPASRLSGRPPLAQAFWGPLDGHRCPPRSCCSVLGRHAVSSDAAESIAACCHRTQWAQAAG